jgi:hypothetical protein
MLSFLPFVKACLVFVGFTFVILMMTVDLYAKSLSGSQVHTPNIVLIRKMDSSVVKLVFSTERVKFVDISHDILNLDSLSSNN